MPIKKIETPGLEKISIQHGNGWQITHHRLFNVSPEDADKVEIKGEGVTAWELCFLEDLLQIVNHSKGLLLDVGWYPHADPSGMFRLSVVPLHVAESKNRRTPYDWDNPIFNLRTRSINDLLTHIHRIVSS